MKLPFYTKFAGYYDLVYARKDYKSEAERLNALIKKFKKSSGSSLLDAGCGTGSHLYFLRKSFNCTGFDDSSEMLSIARRKVPQAAFFKGDLVSFSTKQLFDVITCLFTTIAYLKDKKQLSLALNNFYQSLRPGGIVMIETFFFKEAFDPSPWISCFSGNGVKGSRFVLLRKLSNKARLLIDWFVTDGKQINNIKEQHDLLLLSKKEYLDLLRKRFDFVQYIPPDKSFKRGLFICRK